MECSSGSYKKFSGKTVIIWSIIFHLCQGMHVIIWMSSFDKRH